jgi:DNA-binding SARP family transcriptional activator/tetratricopeptide (TPR) repeat protein
MAPAAEDHAPPLALRVRVLGGFAVEGIEERALGTRKARLLLKRLAVASGRPVAPGDLAIAVWGDDLPQKPNDQLSVLVSRLRSVLGAERLPRTDAGYQLCADSFDLVELERRANEVAERLASGERGSALAAAQGALTLAAGGLLPEEDAPWVDEARPAAQRVVARARLLAAEAALAAGEVGAARAAARGLLDTDPYDEAALRALMRADAMSGQSGAALALYAGFRQRLAEDLGVDPAAETEQLHTAILRDELPTVTGTTRAGTDGVVGRQAELDLLGGFLARAAEGEAMAVVVEGEAGIGKSALLAAWTASLPTDDSDGRRRRAVAVVGRCDELGRDLPLQAVVDGLAGHLAAVGRDAATAILGQDAALLTSVLGGPSLPTGAGRPSMEPDLATTVADSDTGRAALFGALAAALGRASTSATLVLVIDDLHVASPGVAEFLQFVLRRSDHLLVVATRRPEPGPDLPDAVRVRLGPLSVDDAAALVGPKRAEELHDRSGGNPLFLRELAVAGEGVLPDTILAAVRGQLTRLGEGAATVEAAALCGTAVDLQLMSTVTGRPTETVLDDLERATTAGLLRPRGTALAFSHELLRDAIERSTSPARAADVHRRAVLELAGRRDPDPMALARHARLGGDDRTAADALVVAAGQCTKRFDADAAGQLLGDSLELADTPAARLARARLRLSRLDLDGARADASAAIDLGAGVAGFEFAGWVAYYSRDYDAALRYADEGVERADNDALRASCLALSGRIRHTRGDLVGATRRLEEGVAVAPAGIRGMVQIWHAQLLAHQGHADPAAELAQRGLLDPHLPHPFVASHGRFALSYALALSGRWAEALDAVDDLDDLVLRSGDKRFPPVAANMRGWLLRGAGLLDAAMDLHRAAADMAPGPTFREAHFAALLDLAECRLAQGSTEEAAAALADCADIEGWTGSMSWRHRARYRLLGAVIGARDDRGPSDAVEAELRRLGDEEDARGDPRYAWRAGLLAATLRARRGDGPDEALLTQLEEGAGTFGGPDGWRGLAELAVAAGSDALWHRAERRAALVVRDATSRAGVDGTAVAAAVRAQVDALRP